MISSSVSDDLPAPPVPVMPIFAEGWAVYIEQVMLDLGYDAHDPALLLTHWKFYLRAVVNTILDVRIHCFGMTSEDAIALMVDGAFQERSEAEAKDALAKLKGGLSFEALVEQRKLKLKDAQLGFVEKRDFGDSKVGEAVFALNAPGFAEIARTPFGFVVTEVRAKVEL